VLQGGDEDGRVVDRALSFGSFAAAYERYRPGYPEQVADRILEYAGGPIADALEIGAGTGKATRLLAGRGIAVTATEPDPQMLEELRKRVPAAAAVLATFEQLPLVRTYDLVFAAASLHWTLPATRWDRVAALLGPGGTFASFGGPMWLADLELEAAVREARAEVLGSDDVPEAYLTAPSAPMQWPGTELAASPSFTRVEQLVLPRRSTVTAGDWIGHLSTVSAYTVLSDGDRAEVLARTLAVLPPHVEAVADVVLHLATRV
jgi:SAM-dependent methyltransferase